MAVATERAPRGWRSRRGKVMGVAACAILMAVLCLQQSSSALLHIRTGLTAQTVSGSMGWLLLCLMRRANAVCTSEVLPLAAAGHQQRRAE